MPESKFISRSHDRPRRGAGGGLLLVASAATRGRNGAPTGTIATSPSGADPLAAIHEFGGDCGAWFARFLDLTRGIPSEDTSARVRARLDPGEFEKALPGWSRAARQPTEDRPIAIDGKTPRGSPVGQGRGPPGGPGLAPLDGRTG